MTQKYEDVLRFASQLETRSPKYAEYRYLVDGDLYMVNVTDVYVPPEDGYKERTYGVSVVRATEEGISYIEPIREESINVPVDVDFSEFHDGRVILARAILESNKQRDTV